MHRTRRAFMVSSLFYWRNTRADRYPRIEPAERHLAARSSFFSRPLFSIHFSEIFSGFCRLRRACTAISPCTPQRPGPRWLSPSACTYTRAARSSLDENFRRATEAGTGTAGIFEARFVIETGRGSHKAARVHTRVLPACCCEMSLHTWSARSLVTGTTLQIIDRRIEQCLNNVFILTIERGQRAVVYPRPPPPPFARLSQTPFLRGPFTLTSYA